jgi:nucleotide-binding universal stress UspA family protein
MSDIGFLSPVLEEHLMLSINTILQPNDFSEHAKNALQLALAVARDAGARLILLYVKAPQETAMGEFGSLPPEPEPTEEGYLQQLEQLITPEDEVEAECLVRDGNPVDEIVRVAQENKCDLIVLGGHPQSWLGRWLTGDVMERVIHKARCPVVTVRSPG